ncbi:MAG: hypothetical protein A2096_15425 [Spirochaetes bacterium GWF1_41_5]|nr:MAG: hypothetical protein A2096_15425 [Spirochaetes bacterium GWF1_41_5]HBE01031.1 hypothetical protein [Spirochaetia bacterium]
MLQTLKAVIAHIFNDEQFEWMRKKFRIFRLWKQIAGPKTWEHTDPYDYRSAVLYIMVDHLLWMQELSLQKQVFIGKYRDAMNGNYVKDIRFKFGKIIHQYDDEEKPEEDRIDLSKIELNPEELPVNTAGDTDLHTEFDKLMANYYRRIKYDRETPEPELKKKELTSSEGKIEKVFGMRTNFFSGLGS